MFFNEETIARYYGDMYGAAAAVRADIAVAALLGMVAPREGAAGYHLLFWAV